MSLVINTNLASMHAQNSMNTNQASLSTAMQRLSSGLRINSAADDSAGYSIGQRMTSQVTGNNQAARNANDAISLTQTGQGDLSQITTNLQRIRELAVQAANGTNSASDRAAINNEAKQLTAEITRVANNSSFNGVHLLDGSFKSQSFQIGANNTSNDTINITSIANVTSAALGSNSAAVTGIATTAALAAGDLTLNGAQIGASAAGSGAGQSAKSAYAIANAINTSSAASGVTATANATTVAGVAATAFVAVASIPTLTVNGVVVGNIAAGGNAAGQGANTAAAINLVSDKSGVTATADATTGAVTLSAADGREIALGGGFAVANTGLTGGATTQGTVSLSSNASAGITIGGGNFANAGLTGGTTASTSTTLANIDLTTAAGASSALSTIDGALATVSSASASLGAYQNRFQLSIQQLQTSTVNLTASRSRITDADFASETANLSRAQVLQQAGQAMLAQANQSASAVMSLLR